jgi:general nucleoside transport system ATP-binding protein
MSAATTPVVGLDEITKAYPGVVANDRVSIDVRRGEIHAIVGENGAGKTTLMGVMYGLHSPDAGRIRVDGEPVEMTSPRAALTRGIGYVQQHFSLIPTLSVAENLVLALRGDEAEVGVRDGGALVRELGERYGLQVEAAAPVEMLSVGEQQRAEVLKALAREVRVLALDEPDALLTAQEWDELAAVLKRLAQGGIGIFLISHKLRAVLSVADRISVLNRGRLVSTLDAAEADEGRIAELMVGELRRNGVTRKRAPTQGDAAVEVSALTVVSDRGDEAVSGVDFEVRRGEVLGVAGVEGNGQVELTEALAGARPASDGKVVLGVREITGAGVAERQMLGVSHIPADRQRGGLVGSLSVAENLALPGISREPYSQAGFLRIEAIRERASELIEEFDIRVPGPDVPASALSGGNQQKVVLARELSRPVQLLICCYATRGLDIGSAEAVRRQVLALRDEGCAVIWASLELDELLEMTDRILVLHDGELTGELTSGEADAERLGLMMSGKSA